MMIKTNGYHKNETASPDRYDILKENSRNLRKEMTDAEVFLWQNIRSKKLGVTFRRQHPILDYIADFICIPQKLIIEIDGGYHFTKEQQEEDKIRRIQLEYLGYRFLRFTNEDVLYSIENTLNIIKENIE